jgi:ferredoxin-NADP reductase
MIRSEVPDYSRALFYLSGPNGMVADFEHILLNMGINPRHIKKDYFPGFA